MVLKTDKIAERLSTSDKCSPDNIAIIPYRDKKRLEAGLEASVDLRLGRWFLTLRKSRTHLVDPNQTQNGSRATRRYYVPFGNIFVLHPGRFVLGTTLEWLKLPADISGYVTGKSSLGRQGLVIETAAGIHPGFSGCLTLELANMGEAPIALRPGMLICQIFLHEAIATEKNKDGDGARPSTFSWCRRPAIASHAQDEILVKLGESESNPTTDKALVRKKH